MPEGTTFTSDPRPHNPAEDARKDVVERVARIKETLATDSPDESLLRHDLGQLDTAVAALNDSTLAEEAALLRMRYEAASQGRYVEEIAEELRLNPDRAEELFDNLVEDTLDQVEDMRQARALPPKDAEVLRLHGDEDAPKGLEETEAVITWLRAAIDEIKATF